MLGEFPVAWGEWITCASGTPVPRCLHRQEMALANPAIKAILYTITIHEISSATLTSPANVSAWFELLEPASGRRVKTAGTYDATLNETHDPNSEVSRKIATGVNLYLLPFGNWPTGMTIINTRQTVTINGAPTGGNFTLAVRTPGVDYTAGSPPTTAQIAFNAAAATVQTALANLSNVGAGNVTVTGAAGGPYTVEFLGDLRSMNFQAMDESHAGLTGGASPSVTTAVTQQGTHAVYSAAIVNVPHTLWMQNGSTGDADSQIQVTVVGHELSYVP
jgi:hypothetical protein